MGENNTKKLSVNKLAPIDRTKVKLLKGSRLFILIIVTLVVIILIVILVKHNTKSSTVSFTQQQKNLINKVNSDVVYHKYSQAANLINSQNSQLKNSGAVQSVLATIYLDEDEYQQALNVFEKLGTFPDMTEGYAETIAETAVSAKDYSLAVEYFQKAEQLAAKSSGPTSQADVNYLNYLIQQTKAEE